MQISSKGKLMRTIKILLAAVAAVALLALCTPHAAAQQYGILSQLYDGGTNNIAATTTNSAVAKIIGVTKYDDLALDIKFSLTGAGTSNIVFKLDEGTDGVNWLANTRTITMAANGTNAVYLPTNYTVNAMGYLRLNVVENPATNAITNLQIRAYVKPKRNG